MKQKIKWLRSRAKCYARMGMDQFYSAFEMEAQKLEQEVSRYEKHSAYAKAYGMSDARYNRNALRG